MQSTLKKKKSKTKHKLSLNLTKQFFSPFQTGPLERAYKAGSHDRETPQVPGNIWYPCWKVNKVKNSQSNTNMWWKNVKMCTDFLTFQICNSSFATRDRLRSHLACHEDKIPCKVCGKFLRAAYMTDHLKKHSEGTHNYCGICNKGLWNITHAALHSRSQEIFHCLKLITLQFRGTSLLWFCLWKFAVSEWRFSWLNDFFELLP